MHAATPKAAMQKARYRQSNAARLIMSRIHTRPRATKSPGFNLLAVQAVLCTFRHRSVWSDSTDDLTITRIDRSKPLSLTNAMVLQVREVNRKAPSAVLAKAEAMAAKTALAFKQMHALLRPIFLAECRVELNHTLHKFNVSS